MIKIYAYSILIEKKGFNTHEKKDCDHTVNDERGLIGIRRLLAKENNTTSNKISLHFLNDPSDQQILDMFLNGVDKRITFIADELHTNIARVKKVLEVEFEKRKQEANKNGEEID